MSEDIGGYYGGEGEGVAEYDQLKAMAVDRLRNCDSFVALIGDTDESNPSGMRFKVISAVKTPFAPYFLAQAVAAASTLVVESIEQLADEHFEDAGA